MRKMLVDLQRRYADGWDGAGAKRPNDLALRRADLTLDITGEVGIAPTHVVPSVESGISICFADGERYADMEITNNGDVYYALIQDRDIIEMEGLSSETQPVNEAELRAAVKHIKAFVLEGLLCKA